MNRVSVNVIAIAARLRDEFEAVTPFIEKYTSLVCSSCEKVCCVQKHGYHERTDIYFIAALGIEIPHYALSIKETEPCGFLGKNGCSLERWKRPFRCTWYFCETLLEKMSADRGKPFRAFVHSLQELISIRLQLIKEIYGSGTII